MKIVRVFCFKKKLINDIREPRKKLRYIRGHFIIVGPVLLFPSGLGAEKTYYTNI